MSLMSDETTQIEKFRAATLQLVADEEERRSKKRLKAIAEIGRQELASLQTPATNRR